MTFRTALLARTALVSFAAGLVAFGIPGAANAQTASNVNVLNLISPFLSLNSNVTGQTTLTNNLNAAVSVNQNAGGSPTIEAVSISDKAIFSAASLAITLSNGNSASYGPAANLAGGLPPQAVQGTGTVTPSQPNGGYGQLGAAYQAAVAPSGPAVPSVVTLLTNAYSFTSNDLGVAKYYFANGTTNGTTAAVAPAGFTLPTANGYPNPTTSVYDTAYGVSNKGSNQNIYGDSRPVQVVPNQINGFDPTALTGLTTNPSFPSGHTNYAFTDGILTGMLSPQNFQTSLLRASEYGNSRIALGVHYPLDIIASRSFASYDLANMLNNNTNYTSAGTQGQFVTAQSALTPYLASQAASLTCGTIAACAAANPYNSYSLSTYGTNTPTAGAALTSNSQIYAARQSYGLPTLTLVQAPQEAAPAGGPDASILLATSYGGSTASAQTIAPSGGTYARLSTGTINQIIQNTETSAIASFYGTPLSYWSRVDLYDAAGYFGNTIGALRLAVGDQVLSNVSIGNGSTFGGAGALVGTAGSPSAVSVLSGGTLAAGAAGEAAGATLTINGTLSGLAGGTMTFFVPAKGLNDIVVVNGTANLGGLLDLELTSGAALASGLSVLDLINATTLTGDFSGAEFDGVACAATGAGHYNCGSGISFQEVFAGGMFDLYVTNVPEPGTLAVLFGPLAGLAWMRSRRG